jgi:2Fe-2S ferredoxin
MHLLVTDRQGKEHRLESIEGWRVMEVIRDWGMPIKAECGGACSCATCHIYVDPAWLDRLFPATAEEMEQLDTAYAVESNSRLACQILVTPEMDGMRVSLAPVLE